MPPKMSSTIVKTCNEINFGLQICYIMIYSDITPMGGGGGGGGADQPHTPELKFLHMALEWFRPMQFCSLMLTEFYWDEI